MIKNKFKLYLSVGLMTAGIFTISIPVMSQETRIQKRSIISGVPLGSQRSEITKLFAEKSISALQRTVPVDIFPRLIGEISYIKKAYLFYTKDRLSKLEIVFNVPYDSKTPTAEPLFGFYKELRQNLVRSYGQPTNTMTYFHPNFFYELIAVETGNAYLYDYWENVDDMKILLSLKGKEGEIDFTLTYQYIPLFEEK